MSKPDIIGAYDHYLEQKNKVHNQLRATQSAGRMSASSSGQCSKKMWYKKYKPELEEPFSKQLLRVFQLGNLVGVDLDAALTLADYPRKYAEDYIFDRDLNIGGSFDLLIIDEEGKGYLYDYKTANQWSWTKTFGKRRPIDTTSGDHYRFQLGTYGYILEKNYGKQYGLRNIEEMALIGYNKNTSQINKVEVSTDYILFAERYWQEAQKIVDNPTEPTESKTVPYTDWDCKLCNFNKVCDNPANENYEGVVHETQNTK